VRGVGFVKQRADAAAGAGAGLARLGERLNITPTGLVAAVLMVLGWGAARLNGSRTMYLLVYAALMAIVLSWVVTRRRLAVTIVRSELPQRMRVGQLVHVDLQISSARRLASVMLDEHVPATLGRPVRIPVGMLRAGDVLSHGYSLTPALRGAFTVGPVTASWSDPFGFTIHKQALPEPVEILVHPPVEVVHDRILTRMWEDPPIRPPVSKPWPVGFEFYGMRDYVQGDDLRRVVWPVLAKTGKLMVRESEQGITDKVVIFLDTGQEWHSPGEVSETFETAIRAAASLGVRHLSDGFSVTLITNDGPVVSGLRGARPEMAFLDALSRLQRSTKPMSATSGLLLEEAVSHPHVLVISPHLSNRDAQQLRLLTQRGLGVAYVQAVWEESDMGSAIRAATIGARVVQLEAGASLEAVFEQQARARGIR
jgi:uncharacterized protein (DUF58 family)